MGSRVFFIIRLDLIRIVYLFHNYFVSEVNSREIKKKNFCLLKRSVGTYYSKKKEFLIPYYHNKAESKNSFEKILTFTLNWGEKYYMCFFS